jgi:hypothetical protein
VLISLLWRKAGLPMCDNRISTNFLVLELINQLPEINSKDKINIFQEVVLSHVSYLEPKSTDQILKSVISEWGEVTARTLNRYLKQLKADGKIKSVNTDTTTGYLRTGNIRTGTV